MAIQLQIYDNRVAPNKLIYQLSSLTEDMQKLFEMHKVEMINRVLNLMSQEVTDTNNNFVRLTLTKG